MTMDGGIIIKREIDDDFDYSQPIITSIYNDFLYEHIEFENFKIAKQEPETDDSIQFESNRIVIREITGKSKKSENHKFVKRNPKRFQNVNNFNRNSMDFSSQFIFDGNIRWKRHDFNQLQAYKPFRAPSRQNAKNSHKSIISRQLKISVVKMNFFCTQCNCYIEKKGPFHLLDSNIKSARVKFLCNSCFKRASERKQLIILIKKLTSFSCIQCSYSIEKDGPFHVKINSKGSSFKFICINCVNNSISPVSVHNQLMVPKCSKIICWDCNKVFSNMSNLRIHNETEHLKDKIAFPEYKNTSELAMVSQFGAFRLKITHNQHFKWYKGPSNNLMSHIDEVHRHKSCFCNVCNEAFTTHDNAERQMRFAHEDLQQMDGCMHVTQIGPVKAVCKKVNCINVHLMATHREVREMNTFNNLIYKCNWCSRQFACKTNLYRHISEVHNKPKKFFCEVCRTGYTRKYSLDIHVKKAHKVVEQKDNEIKANNTLVKLVHFNAAHKKMKQIVIGNMFSCDQCPRKFTSKGSQYRHIKEIHNRQKYVCEVCKRVFKRKYNLDTHMKHCHKIVEQIDKSVKAAHVNNTQVKPMKASCNNVKRINAYFKAAYKKRMNFGNSFRCPQCPSKFTSKGNRCRHINRVHNRQKNVCEGCNKVFIKKYNLDTHMKHCYKVVEQIDESVKAAHVNNTQVKPVKVAHKKKKNNLLYFFKCHQCPQKFISKGNRYRHIKKFHNIQNNICNVCKKVFIKKYNLDTHMKHFHKDFKLVDNQFEAASKEAKLKNVNYKDTFKKREQVNIFRNKKFKCSQCPSKFTCEPSLHRHVKEVHNKEKKFICGMCKKAFARKSYLDGHINIFHKNIIWCDEYVMNTEDNMEQTVAQENVLQIENANSDSKIDSQFEVDIKNFSCGKCNKSFAFKQGLKRHCNSAHKENVEQISNLNAVHEIMKKNISKTVTDNVTKNFLCSECEKTFGHLRNLKRHFRTVHRNKKLKRNYINAGNNDVEANILKTTNNVTRNFSCSECEKTFVYIHSLKKHFRTKHKSKKLQLIDINSGNKNAKQNIFKTQTDNIIRNFACSECEKTFAYGHSLKKHFRTKHKSKKLQLKDIASGNKNVKLVIPLARTDDDVIENFVCSECKKTFASKQNLYMHFMIHKAHRNKTNLEDTNLKLLDAIHKIGAQQNSKPRTDNVVNGFYCGECKKSYVYKYNLLKHCRDIHGNKTAHSKTRAKNQITKQTNVFVKDAHETYPCGEYGKRFAFEKEVKTHFDTVHRSGTTHGEKSRDKNVTQKNKNAKSSHKNEEQNISKPRADNTIKNFSCGECKKTFVVKGSLKRHFNACHKNRTMHMCDRCRRAFRSKASLSIHSDIFHKRNHKNRCVHCKRVFTNERYLKEHIDAYHRKIKRFKCLKCDKKYSSQKILNVHFTKTHK